MDIRYQDLSHEDFDAVVTGELTHLALWHENELINIIASYFIGDTNKSADFVRLLLRRDGLTVQDKLEIVRAMEPLFLGKVPPSEFRSVLKSVEDFKSERNTMAHGIDVTPSGTRGQIIVEVVSRSGKSKQITITPESHATQLAIGDKILEDLRKIGTAISSVQ